MIGTYSNEKCPECGGKMIIIKEIITFDGTIENCKCENCKFIAQYERN